MTAFVRFRPFPPRACHAALIAIVTIGAASSAAAAPKKKHPKPADADSSEAAAPADSSAAPAPTAAPAADATPPKAEVPEAVAPAAPPPKDQEVPITDTREDPNRRYYFIGLRYRGTIIPKFLVNLFVDEGTTVYSNTFGAELDMRKGGQSTIPWIVYTDYSMGDTLFHQKGQSTIPGNYSVVNSGLKAIFLGLDELWSVPIDESHHWDFEFGFGVGIGVLFGDLQNNWVHEQANPDGPLAASTGVHYAACQAFDSGPTGPVGCRSGDHTGNPSPKVGGYVEPNWFNGGSVPVIFPHISFPQLSLRYKPIKQVEARLGLGFSLTGFWLGLSADYGLEKRDDKVPKASSSHSRLHDML